MEIKVCANQEAGPFWGPKRGYNKGNIWYLKNIPLTNQCPKCIDIWYPDYRDVISLWFGLNLWSGFNLDSQRFIAIYVSGCLMKEDRCGVTFIMRPFCVLFPAFSGTTRDFTSFTELLGFAALLGGQK